MSIPDYVSPMTESTTLSLMWTNGHDQSMHSAIEARPDSTTTPQANATVYSAIATPPTAYSPVSTLSSFYNPIMGPTAGCAFSSGAGGFAAGSANRVPSYGVAAGYRAPVFPTPWQAGGGLYASRLEQCMVLVFAGYQWFFRISVWLEDGSRGGIRPYVSVQLDKPNAAAGKGRIDMMLFVGMELQAKLLAELNKAIGEHGGSVDGE